MHCNANECSLVASAICESELLDVFILNYSSWTSKINANLLMSLHCHLILVFAYFHIKCNDLCGVFLFSLLCDCMLFLFLVALTF